MGYLERIKEWKVCVISASREFDAVETLDQFEIDHNNLFTDTTDLGTDIELGFRGALAEYLKVSSSEIANENSDVVKLLKFAFRFAIRFHTRAPVQIAKLPFVLIEDIMESQTIEKAEALWQIVESLVDVITHPDIFPKGKLTTLRMCNSLLRKLSKSCNTEFCGRVLMFLAAIYPLSEKSALNLSGKINTNNVTYFESEEVFLANKGVLPSSAEGSASEAEGGEGAAGDERGEREQGEQGDMEVVVLDGPDDADAENSATGTEDIAYDVYKAFWNLQSFFASEQKLLDNLSLWRDFSSHCRRVLELFEAHDFTDEELHQAHAHAAEGKSAKGSVGGVKEAGVQYSGCKYLTSSQLFALQLRDPTVRQQIAVQVLYFLHYLRAKNSPLASAEALPEVSKDMLFLHDRACKLIERSPNDGAQLLSVLKRLLSREVRFIQWKGLGCPETEIPRPVISEEEAAKLAAADLHKRSSQSFALYKKRPTLRVKVKRSANPNATALLAGYQFDHSDAHVKDVARELVKNIPTYEDEIQEYIEAEDPDAGIEEEYHPKNNNLYCWRTRRLMAAQHLSSFEAMLDGDIGKGLRKLNNLPEQSEQKESREEEGSASGAGAESATESNDPTVTEVPEQVETVAVAEEVVDRAQDANAEVQEPAPAAEGAEEVASAEGAAEDGQEVVEGVVVKETKNTRKRKADDPSDETREAKK